MGALGVNPACRGQHWISHVFSRCLHVYGKTLGRSIITELKKRGPMPSLNGSASIVEQIRLVRISK